MMNDVQFEFMGLNPDDKIRNFVSTVAERLHFSAPSDSGMKLVLEESKDAIRASCRIVSLAGTFVADAVSDNPVRAVQQIEKEMGGQLDEWKRCRFGKDENAGCRYALWEG
ncbi:MAG: hypothetical protein JNM39_12915 [Bdellovibrionaceae bacterium]|nr:hypothetical protein [Pseudobdellovibrionaceae bacterium]